MKVALYGSACNPPHVAHQNVLLDLKSLNFDEVWFMPCYGHMFGKDMIDAKVRLALANLTAEAVGAVLCDYEMRVKKTCPSYETLKALELENPDVDFTLAMGGDNLENIQKWFNWEQLVSKYAIVGYSRFGYEPIISTLDKFKSLTLRELSYLDLSSTQIRKWLRNNDTRAKKFLHPSVYQYIQENGIYSGERT